MAVFTEIARRGLSHPNTVSFVKRAVAGHNGEDKIEIPIWGSILFYASFIIGAMLISLVSYSLNQVLTTLCMVETPVAAITISPSTHEAGSKEDKEPLLEAGPQITLVHQKPITSSIRGTLKHLTENAGRWSRFRGIKVHFLYALAVGIVSTPLKVIVPPIPGQSFIIVGVTAAALANLHASWTHKVIAMPTTKNFWQRIPAARHWKTLALPAAIEAVMPYVAIYITCGFGMLMGLHKLKMDEVREYNGAQSASLIISGIVVFIVAIMATLFLCIPAVVTLIRIEASILPEDQDTIVPFDRTFAGKASVTGSISFLDAWRSFKWEARRRLLKLYVKVFAIVTGLFIIVAHILVAEMFIIMGPAIGAFLAREQKEGGLFAQVH